MTGEKNKNPDVQNEFDPSLFNEDEFIPIPDLSVPLTEDEIDALLTKKKAE